jgi:hypothetical protein
MKKTKTKGKKILSLFIIIAMVIGLLPKMAMPVFAGDITSGTWQETGTVAEGFEGNGAGTAPDPFIIKTAGQLAYLAKNVSNGTDYSGKYICLTSNIDLQGKNWIPIGKADRPFAGAFNGNGYVISNLTANDVCNDGYEGLFGYNTGIITKVGVENVDIYSGGDYAGGFVGYNKDNTQGDGGQIIDCYVKGGTVHSNGLYTGGFAGYNDSYYVGVKNCYSTVNVTGSDYVGGFGGYNQFGDIADNFATGTALATTTVAAGFIVGGFFNGAYDNMQFNYYVDKADKKGNSGNDDADNKVEHIDDIANLYGDSLLGLDWDAGAWDTVSAWRIVEGDTPELLTPIETWADYADSTWVSGEAAAGHDGSNEAKAYRIGNAEDLAALAVLVNKGETFAGKYIKVAEGVTTIDLAAHEWKSAGALFDEDSIFGGTFDGNNAEITNMRMSERTDQAKGLFGIIGPNSCIKNMKLTEVSLTVKKSGEYIGCVASINMGGIISNITVTGDITGNIIYEDDESGVYIGGIAGAVVPGAKSVSGLVEQCASYVDIDVRSAANSNIQLIAGGITGLLDCASTIQNCYNRGDVLIETVSAEDCVAGGICGANRSVKTVKYCYNTGAVTAIDASADSKGYAGQITGSNSGAVKGCFFDSSVTANEGMNAVGMSGSVGDAVDEDNYLKTAIEMKTQSTYETGFANPENAWDFTNIWKITSANDGYPILQAMTFFDADTDNWNGIIPGSDPGFAYSGGSGTAESPYLIANSCDLAMLASNVNTTTDYSVGKYFKMTADIDLNPGITVNDATTAAHEWTPIGKSSPVFKGTFDGGGFAVKGMYLKDKAGSIYYGLFGSTTNATIKNLGVTDSFVNIKNSSGGAAGIIGFAWFSTVESCYNTAKINGYMSVGGVVGVGSVVTVKNCYNTGEISGTMDYIGGVVGQGSNTIIQDCYNTGNISGLASVGGIVGFMMNPSAGSASAMYRCYNIGNIVASEVESNYSGSSYSGSGGIAGWVISWISTIPNRMVPLDSCVSLGLSVSTTSILVPNTTIRVAQGNGTISNSYARSDMKVNDMLIYNGTRTNEHGQNLIVAQNTAQDWSTWFGTADTAVWDFPTAGKLWYQAPLPTLKGVGGIQNPKLPGTGSGVTDTYSVIYNGNGATSGSVAAQTTNVGTATTVAANGFAKTGYTFNGWNTATNGSGTAYAAGGTVPSQAAGVTVSLYAQWTDNTYSVSGTVKDSANNPTGNANVKLMKGNTQIGTHGVTTASDGTFTIAGVPNGTYNLVVSKDDLTVTTIVVINNSNNLLSSTITLPYGNTSSVLEVKGSETPQLVVGNLDGQFSTTVTENDKGVTAADNTAVAAGGSVEIKLTAEIKDITAVNASAISAAASSNGNTVGIFIDLSVLKTVKDSVGNEIASQSSILTELPSLITVFIPIPAALQGQSNYAVYRYHGSAVDSITTTVADGEKIELVDNNTTIKLTIKKFSTYAIAYTTPSTPPAGGDSSGSSSSSAASSMITAEQSKGGIITIGTDQKTATITPDDGYVTAEVIVDGNSVGAIEKYSFTDSKKHTITAVFVTKSALPYYLKNEGNIYIGFSAIAGKSYKYIAPAGVTVAFRDNPKNFSDNTIVWAKPSIDFVTERELFLGTSKNTFSPNESMTRAMFVTVIGRLYERSYGSISGTGTFTDVDEKAYYARYVAWANEKGIIKGIGENKFAPNEQVTREQMAVIMLNFASFLKKAVSGGGSLTYPDSASISSWAIDGAKYCQETKVITGREGGSFIPQGNATRAEVAAVIERFVKIIVK